MTPQLQLPQKKRPGLLKMILLKSARAAASVPLVAIFLADKNVGGAYGIGAIRKAGLLFTFRNNRRKVRTESRWQEHLQLAASILQVPPSVKGDVIECGCYKGGSSVNLSVVCALVGRKLIICDSFEGLPEPTETEKVHYSLYSNHYDHYEKGRFSASLDEVKRNLEKCGRLDVCEFVVGFFDKSLVNLNKSYVMAFFDADLVESLKPCLLEIWPHLQEGCRMYVHEAKSLSLVSLFFDRSWWQHSFSIDPPGFVGAGTGLPLLPIVGSELGFAMKNGQTSSP